MQQPEEPIEKVRAAQYVRMSTEHQQYSTATHPNARSRTPKSVDGLSTIDMARMEREMSSLTGDFKKMEDSYGKNVLNLVIVVGYLNSLMGLSLIHI